MTTIVRAHVAHTPGNPFENATAPEAFADGEVRVAGRIVWSPGGVVRKVGLSLRRATVVVLDACGVGELPDAAAYGDAGSNTLAHLAEQVGGLRLPTLERLGLGAIVPIAGISPAPGPAVYGRLRPLGPGKESTTGHWELMGVVPQALPTYPEGFPADVVRALEERTGWRFCCNRPYSGTEVIKDYGEHHLKTGEAILYTSADSVLQIAVHVDVIPESELYAACEAARRVMTGEHAVGRVIARPFDGAPGAFRRREGRRDYALRPPGRSYLEELQARRRAGARRGQDPRPVRRGRGGCEAPRRHQCRRDRRDASTVARPRSSA